MLAPKSGRAAYKLLLRENVMWDANAWATAEEIAGECRAGNLSRFEKLATLIREKSPGGLQTFMLRTRCPFTKAEYMAWKDNHQAELAAN